MKLRRPPSVGALQWRESSYSTSEGAKNAWRSLSSFPGGSVVRDSKLGTHSPVLVFAIASWQAMVSGARAGQRDA